MNKTEDTIAMLNQLIKHLEAGHEVMNVKLSRAIGELLSATLHGPEFSSVVDIRIEYRSTKPNE